MPKRKKSPSERQTGFFRQAIRIANDLLRLHSAITLVGMVGSIGQTHSFASNACELNQAVCGNQTNRLAGEVHAQMAAVVQIDHESRAQEVMVVC